MSNKNKILVGQFGSPIGLNGEIKINIMTSTFEVFNKLNDYSNFEGTIIWSFSNIRFKGNKCFAKLDNYFSIEDVLKLKGQKIYSSKTNLPSTKDNEYYVNDLIGCKLIIRDNNISGQVINIKNFGAGDLLEVKLDKKIVLIPFNNENNISVNLEKKEITADPIVGILD